MSYGVMSERIFHVAGVFSSVASGYFFNQETSFRELSQPFIRGEGAALYLKNIYFYCWHSLVYAILDHNIPSR